MESPESAAIICGGIVVSFFCLLTCTYGCKQEPRTNSTTTKETNKTQRQGNRTSRLSLLSSPHSRHEPLLLPTPTPMPQMRAQASFRHAEEDVHVCAHCGFENLRRFVFCRLCTHALNSSDTRDRSNGASTSVTRSKSTNAVEKHSPSRPGEYAQRQRRARSRREWVRKLDVNGDLYWYREALSPPHDKRPSSSSEFYVPLFTARSDDDALKTESGSEDASLPMLSRQVLIDALNASAASVQLDLVKPSDADPMRLAVSNDEDDAPTESISLSSSDSLRETLALASEGFMAKFAHFAAAAERLVATAASEQLVQVTLTLEDEQAVDKSLELLAAVPRESVRCVFDVVFTDHVAVHAVERYEEWLGLLDDALADPDAGVFRHVSHGDKRQRPTVYLNATSRHDIGEQHLLHYLSSGRLVGRAMLEGYTISYRLALPLLKMMAGVPLELADVAFVDAAAFARVEQALGATDVETLGLTFSVVEESARSEGSDTDDEEGDSDAGTVVDLIPDGRNVAVTEANKHEFAARVFRYTLFERVSSQLFAFLRGFFEVVPRDLLLLFDAEELGYILCDSHEITASERAAERGLNAKATRKNKSTKRKAGRYRHRRSSSSSLGEAVVGVTLEGAQSVLEIALAG